MTVRRPRIISCSRGVVGWGKGASGAQMEFYPTWARPASFKCLLGGPSSRSILSGNGPGMAYVIGAPGIENGRLGHEADVRRESELTVKLYHYILQPIVVPCRADVIEVCSTVGNRPRWSGGTSAPLSKRTTRLT